MSTPADFKRRIDSITLRIKTLSSLRNLVALPYEHDIEERQWDFLNAKLEMAENRILIKLRKGIFRYLSRVKEILHARKLNTSLGEIELEMARAFAFFDTYMDVLTQRHSSELGPLLAGCDILAKDALIRDHPILTAIQPPLVYCDRGFGASILREDVLLFDGTRNPMPLIQIPYSRLREKYNLTSILHEAGHQAMVRLGLATALPKAIRYTLQKAGASEEIKDLFALWTSEIGPDFWGFCASGIAQVATMREIFALPAKHVFRVSWTDPHPPGFLRTLLSFEWCRQEWGNGDWDEWEKEWLELYPLKDLSSETAGILKEARTYIPVISKVLFKTKFRVLDGNKIADLFNLSALDPDKLRSVAAAADSGVLNLKGLTPCAQLAVFRLVREQGYVKEEMLDKIMTKWLLSFGKAKKKNSLDVGGKYGNHKNFAGKADARNKEIRSDFISIPK